MDLNFGEIVEPSSRAFWDDFDEGQEEDAAPVEPLNWEWMNEDGIEHKFEKIQHLLILEGQGILAFVSTAVLKGKVPLCQLSNGTTRIYNLAEKHLMVCVSEEKELNSFGRITEKMGPWLLSAEQVSAVTIVPNVMHKGTPDVEKEQVCFLRAVNGQVKEIRELEAPNVLTGLAAGALGYRKFHDKTASAYACYLDSPTLDSVATKPILKLLKSLSIDCDESYELKFRTSSNLYM
ncbi:uncharacterized protein LOC129755359 [Uranotaenia lowii]|uniref:uncharacterized protein LOC129755359 n=1 Tax=Uranotaenia lowii TaxID=190385 RepID=UPI00247AF6F3|nr:uncharacterized protein LOC129755359 [Uranotaenia lowii]